MITPLATVTALYFVAHIPDFQMKLALQFAQFMTDMENQLDLIRQLLQALALLDAQDVCSDLGRIAETLYCIMLILKMALRPDQSFLFPSNY